MTAEDINKEDTVYKTIEEIPEDDYLEIIKGDEDEDLEDFEDEDDDSLGEEI